MIGHCSDGEQGLPSVYIEKQRSCRSLHGFDLYFGLWTHGRIGLLERIEIEDCSKNLVGNRRASPKKSTEAV